MATKSIGEKLKRLRKWRNLTATELAHLSGVHQTTISAIENGRHKSPGIDTIERLAKALRVSPLYFFEDKVLTPLDLPSQLPLDLVDFLLGEESLPYLMLSKKAYETGIPSEAIDRLITALQEASASAGAYRKEKRDTERRGVASIPEKGRANDAHMP